MKKIILAALLALLPSLALAQGPTGPSPLIGGANPVIGAGALQCLYNNGGVLGFQACGGAPSGAAGGDLAGTYPNPTLASTIGTAVSFTGLGATTISQQGASASALTLTGGTVTTSQPLINATQTWNNAAVAFTGLKLNVTQTAYSTSSLLTDLQVAGSSKFSVDYRGSIVGAYSATFGSGGWAFDGSGNGRTILVNSGQFGWSSAGTAFPSSTLQTILASPAAATLQLGAANGSGAAVAQTITVQGSSGNSAAPALFTIAGSDQSGTATTGGGVKIRGGNGTSAGGTVEIWTSATTTPAVAASWAASGVLTQSAAMTLSAALTYGGVTLSNAVTGTGNMVLSANPTFTGTVSTGYIAGSASSTNAGTPLLELVNSSASGSFFRITNGSSLSSKYIPTFWGRNKLASSSDPGAGIYFQGDTGFDTAVQNGVIEFAATKSGTARLATAQTYNFLNYDLLQMAITAGGQLLLPQYYTTAGLLQNDASGNVTTLTGALTLPTTVSATGFIQQSGSIINETTTARTLGESDNGKTIYCSNASAITITVPASLGAGFSVTVYQTGAGKVTFAASSTTINSYGALLSIVSRYGGATLFAYAADTFLLSGNLGS